MTKEQFNAIEYFITSYEQSDIDEGYKLLNRFSKKEVIVFYTIFLSQLTKSIYKEIPYMDGDADHNHFPSKSFLLPNGIKTWIGIEPINDLPEYRLNIYFELYEKYAYQYGTNISSCKVLKVVEMDGQSINSIIKNESPQWLLHIHFKKVIEDYSFAFLDAHPSAKEKIHNIYAPHLSVWQW